MNNCWILSLFRVSLIILGLSCQGYSQHLCYHHNHGNRHLLVKRSLNSSQHSPTSVNFSNNDERIKPEFTEPSSFSAVFDQRPADEEHQQLPIHNFSNDKILEEPITEKKLDVLRTRRNMPAALEKIPEMAKKVFPKVKSSELTSQAPKSNLGVNPKSILTESLKKILNEIKQSISQSDKNNTQSVPGSSSLSSEISGISQPFGDDSQFSPTNDNRNDYGRNDYRNQDKPCPFGSLYGSTNSDGQNLFPSRQTLDAMSQIFANAFEEALKNRKYTEPSPGYPQNAPNNYESNARLPSYTIQKDSPDRFSEQLPIPSRTFQQLPNLIPSISIPQSPMVMLMPYKIGENLNEYPLPSKAMAQDSPTLSDEQTSEPLNEIKVNVTGSPSIDLSIPVPTHQESVSINFKDFIEYFMDLIGSMKKQVKPTLAQEASSSESDDDSSEHQNLIKKLKKDKIHKKDKKRNKNQEHKKHEPKSVTQSDDSSEDVHEDDVSDQRKNIFENKILSKLYRKIMDKLEGKFGKTRKFHSEDEQGSEIKKLKKNHKREENKNEDEEKDEKKVTSLTNASDGSPDGKNQQSQSKIHADNMQHKRKNSTESLKERNALKEDNATFKPSKL